MKRVIAKGVLIVTAAAGILCAVGFGVAMWLADPAAFAVVFGCPAAGFAICWAIEEVSG